MKRTTSTPSLDTQSAVISTSQAEGQSLPKKTLSQKSAPQKTTKQTITTQKLNQQLTNIVDGVDQALEWVEQTRAQIPRLDMEADQLNIKLHRCRHKAHYLAESALHSPAIGFIGLAQAGKSELISTLLADENERLITQFGTDKLDFFTQIKPQHLAASVVLRFSSHRDKTRSAAQTALHNDYPVQLKLLSEKELALLLVTAFIYALNPAVQTVEIDEQAIIQHLQTLQMQRQPQPVNGITTREMVALWDYLQRHDGKRQKQFNAHFWPTAIKLAPWLNVEGRAQLFSLLWNEQPDLTATYQQFAQTLHHLDHASHVLAPLSVLVDDYLQPANGLIHVSPTYTLDPFANQSVSVCPCMNGNVISMGKNVNLIDLSLTELRMLTAEVLIPLAASERERPLASTDILDFPAYGGDFAPATLTDEQQTPLPQAELLLRAKRACLLERYTEHHALHWLLVCTAAGERSEVSIMGKMLDHWVKQTQGETVSLRSQRKPGLAWALTRFDQRIMLAKNHDQAVQRYIGYPGNAWGTLLARDKRGVERTINYLENEVRSDVKLARIREQLQELQRELLDNLLGPWCQNADTDNPQQKQRAAEILLKALQTRTGVHGELLEHLQPSRDVLRRLYLQQQPSSTHDNDSVAYQPEQHVFPYAGTFGVGVEIDLFDETRDLTTESINDEQDLIATSLLNSESVDEVNAELIVDTVNSSEQSGKNPQEADYARHAYHIWINHLRQLPDNLPLLTLLGVHKPIIEMLVNELITASLRLQLEEALIQKLTESESGHCVLDQKAERQVSHVLNIIGDFVAWLGFQHVPEAQRPDSRINRGHKIFVRPIQPAVSWSPGQRLTRLSAKPINNTAFYIYDWLVALYALMIENVGYRAGKELNTAQRQQLNTVLLLTQSQSITPMETKSANTREESSTTTD